MGKAVRLRGAKSKPFTTTPSRAFHSADPASTVRPSPSTDEEGYTPNTRREKSFRQGDRCAIRRPDGSRLTGMVQFVGEIGPLGKGVWVGVQLDEPKGDSNGLIHGRRIFDCPPNHGAFYLRAEVEPEVEDAGAEDESPQTVVQEGGKRKPPWWERKGTLGSSSTLAPEDGEEEELDSEPEDLPASRHKSVVAGRGLRTAIVNQLSQFVITAHDANGTRLLTGGEGFTVAVRGVRPPSQLRSKLIDNYDGTYTVEYKSAVSGELAVHVWLDGAALKGSPFKAESMTLRPQASRCVLGGNGLNWAVARQPTSFEIDFVDALGHVAYAEELDVRVVKFEPLPVPVVSPTARGATCREDPSAAEDEEKAAMEERLNAVGMLRILLKKAQGLDSADLNGKSDPYVVLTLSGEHLFKSSLKSKTINPTWNEVFEQQGTLTEFLDNPTLHLNVFDSDNPAKPERDESLGAVTVNLDFLREEDTKEYTEPLPTKGKVIFEVTWEPPAPPEEEAPKFVSGDERFVIGKSHLMLREGISKDSSEVLKLPPGTRLQLHSVRETEEGFRAHVLVVDFPTEFMRKLPKKQREAYKRACYNASGYITAMHTDGRRRLAKKHVKLGADERRVQNELWNRRQGADKALASLSLAAKASVEFSHELADCERGIAFAYGGLYPGTLHAHGALVKTHSVHYSVGASGTYLLHVGLRQKEAVLPGSPFVLEVKPGQANAPSSELPKHRLPLQTMVGTRGSFLLHLADSMGNRCIEGGARLQVTLDTPDVQATSEDQEDGSYLISWTGEKSGEFQLSITLCSAHVRGSPTPLVMRAADIEVAKSEVEAENQAVAGVKETYKLICRDAFGNHAESLEKLKFGVILVPMITNEKTAPKAERNERKSRESLSGDANEEKTEKASTKATKLNKEERANLVKTMPSFKFDGHWEGATYSMSFVPRDAGDFEVHVWCDKEGDGTRSFFPGCPFLLHVSPGKACATNSSVRAVSGMSAEERPDGELSAGERLTCKVQLHDEYGNCAPVVLGMRDDDELIATLDSPIGPIPLTVKQTMVEEGQNTRQGGKKTEKTTVTQAVGAYEIVSPELARAGEHTVTISLHGEEIKGSPIEFVVKPAAPIATKSWLQLQGTPVVNEETVILLQLVDKYGNYLERGDVRVDAKAYGAKASDCAVTDQENGQYLIKLVAAVPGEYKVQARLENAELNLLPFRVEAASLNQAANAPAPAPAAAMGATARTDGTGADATGFEGAASFNAADPAPAPDISDESAASGKPKKKKGGKTTRGGGKKKPAQAFSHGEAGDMGHQEVEL